MKKNRYIPLLASAAIGILTEIMYFWPPMIYVAAAMSAIIILFAVRQISRAGQKREKFYIFFILPAIFALSTILFSTIVSRLLAQILYGVNAVFLYLYFRHLYYFLHYPRFARKSEESLRNLSSFGNFLAVFFASSAVYGLQSLLNVRIWILIFPLLVVLFSASFQVLRSNRIDRRQGIFYALVVSLVLVEAAWTVSFLPLNHYVTGSMMAIFYYMAINLTRFHLLNTLDNKTIKKYLTLGFLCLILIVLTARWL